LEHEPEINATLTAEKSRNVLDQPICRRKCLCDADVLVEEAGAAAGEAGALASDAEVLAGEAADEKINGTIALPSRYVTPPECTNIVLSLDTGPSGGEHSPAEGIILDLRDDAEARALQTKIEAADAREQGHDIHDSVACS
jgi:hypothetical protein